MAGSMLRLDRTHRVPKAAAMVDKPPMEGRPANSVHREVVSAARAPTAGRTLRMVKAALVDRTVILVGEAVVVDEDAVVEILVSKADMEARTPRVGREANMLVVVAGSAAIHPIDIQIK